MSKLIASKMPCPWCPSSDGYHEYENNFHCFSCHKSKRKGVDKSRSLFPTWTALEQYENRGFVKFPKTVTSWLPQPAMKWLLEAGMTKELILKNNILYVEHEIVPAYDDSYSIELHNRIILPYIAFNGIEDEVVFYQARSVDPLERRKYITVGLRQAFYSNQNIDLELPSTKEVVIVEDILSAIRVGEYVDAIALCGTSMGDELIRKVKDNYEEVMVWMDNDAPGIKASNKIVKRLRLYCKKVVQIKHKVDTKRCHRKELEEVLSTST